MCVYFLFGRFCAREFVRFFLFKSFVTHYGIVVNKEEEEEIKNYRQYLFYVGFLSSVWLTKVLCFVRVYT